MTKQACLVMSNSRLDKTHLVASIKALEAFLVSKDSMISLNREDNNSKVDSHSVIYLMSLKSSSEVVDSSREDKEVNKQPRREKTSF